MLRNSKRRRAEFAGRAVHFAYSELHRATELSAAVTAQWPHLSFAGALFAVAGPIDLVSGDVTVLNTGLRLPRQHLETAFDCSVVCVNDFYAQAHAVPHLSEYRSVLNKNAQEGSPDVKSAPCIAWSGQWLGMATLIPQPHNQWRVLASEGGHADLAPGSFLEAELWSVLAQQHQHVCWETVQRAGFGKSISRHQWYLGQCG